MKATTILFACVLLVGSLGIGVSMAGQTVTRDREWVSTKMEKPRTNVPVVGVRYSVQKRDWVVWAGELKHGGEVKKFVAEYDHFCTLDYPDKPK